MTTSPTTDQPNAANTEQEAARVGATFTLAMHKKLYPDLNRALAEARLDLAAAIQALDRAVDKGEPGIAEDIIVSHTTTAHAQALADLLRGQARSYEPVSDDHPEGLVS